MADWALCITLVLAALAGSVSCQTYQDFLRKHVDYPRTAVDRPERYCEIVMQRQNINRRGFPCKPRNTFVHAPNQDVVDACYQTPDADNRYTTPNRLDITDCRVRPRSTWPNCRYRNQQALRFVVVNCNVNRLPVHLNSTRL